MKWREEKQQAQRQLSQSGIQEAKTDAALLLYAAVGWSMTQYLLHQEDEATLAEMEAYHEMIAQRCTGTPLQHITGRQDFMGLTFHTGPQALIPRQDTEILTQQALAYLQKNDALKEKGTRPRVLDLCTGSGCIAISLARLYPEADYVAADISSEALALAQRNALDLCANVTFIQGDLFDALKALPKNQQGPFDLIVANPPYIPTAEIAHLDREVKDHDPLLALDGGKDGLSVYRPLIAGASEHLTLGGVLMLEIGADQAEEVSALMKKNDFTQISVMQDLAGKDRVVTGRNKNSRRR